MKTMQVFFLPLFISVLFFTTSFSQDTGSPEALKLPFNSTYHELNPVPFKNGKAIYFTRTNHPDNRYGNNSQDIWKSHLKENGQWSEAERLPDKVNLARYNTVFNTFEEGDQLLINGVFNNNGLRYKRGLSFISKEKGEWGKPKALDIPKMNKINDGKFFGAFMNQEKDLLILSCTRNHNGESMDLYACQKENGEWQKPEKLEEPISTDFSEESPSLSPGGDTLFFASNRPGEKDFNVYYSLRKGPLQWGEPQAFENVVNSEDFESYLRMSNGRKGFFVSKNLEGKNTHADIYTFIMPISKSNMVSLAGQLTDNLFQKPLPDSIPWNLSITTLDQASRIDKAIRDSLLTRQNASFYALLPRHYQYQIRVHSPRFPAITDTLDLTSKTPDSLKRDYTTAVRLPVKTRLSFKKKDGNKMPENFSPEILVNNTKLRKKPIEDNSIAFPLSPGKTHLLTIRSDSFATVQRRINLQQVSSPQRNLTIKLERINTSQMVTVKGKVLNEATKEPLQQAFKVIVDKDTTTGNADHGTYQVSLKAGSKYTIHADKAGFMSKHQTINITSEKSDPINLDLTLSPLTKGARISLDHIYFESGKAKLLDSSFKELDRLAGILKRKPNMKIEIQGYTDSIGSKKYNKDLSERRAKAVKDYLLKQNFKEERIRHKGFGEKQPVAPNDTPEGRQKNRRVEFEILEE